MFLPDPPVLRKKPILKKKMPPYSGIAGYCNQFELAPPAPTPKPELPTDKKAQQKEELNRLYQERTEALAADWNPHANPNATELVDVVCFDTMYFFCNGLFV